MTAPLFVAPRSALVSDEVVLDGAEGHHAAAVRRVQVGERVDVTDTAGLMLECIVTAVDGKRSVRLAVVERVEHPEPALRFTVVQGIPKGERGELAVEMLSEAGVDVIVPWTAQRCVAQWKGERGERSARRWASTAHEASKQAHRGRFPSITAPSSTDHVTALLRDAARAVVLHEEGDTPITEVEMPAEGDAVVVVGPEGGISPAELDAFRAAGACIARLGPTVLRTSTAGVVGLGVLLSRSERWRKS